MEPSSQGYERLKGDIFVDIFIEHLSGPSMELQKATTGPQQNMVFDFESYEYLKICIALWSILLCENVFVFPTCCK